MKRLLSLLALAVLPVFAQAQAAPAMTFTLSTTSPDGKTVVPKLTWSTAPAATSCTASGGWTGTKAASGTQTLSAVSASTTFSLQCDWAGVTKATINWTPPTQNTDGSTLTDLKGYKILYGTSATALDTVASIAAPATSWTSPDLAAGTWYFGVKSVNALDLESALSNVVTKTTAPAETLSRSLNLGILIPKPPVIQ